MTISLISDMPAAKYYADPCETPSLSQSMATQLALWSPAHGRLKHPKLGAEEQEDDSTPSRDWGQIMHSLVLGTGSEVEVLDVPDFKAKSAQQARDLARALGKVPVTASKFEAAEKAAKVISRKIADLDYALDGQSEVTALWEETATDGTIVQCRGRLDHLSASRVRIYDFKTTSDARPHVLARHMTEYGYDIQAAAYTRAIERIFPELAGRVEFVFLFAETDAPYPVTPAVCAGSMRQLGELKWLKAVDTWADCLRTGVWGDYVSEAVRVEAPPWEVARFLAA